MMVHVGFWQEALTWLLPSTTSWWCGEDSAWQGQRERLADFVVAPTFPGSDTTQGFAPHGVAELPAAAREQLLRDIDDRPAAYTLQARVRPSEKERDGS